MGRHVRLRPAPLVPRRVPPGRGGPRALAPGQVSVFLSWDVGVGAPGWPPAQEPRGLLWASLGQTEGKRRLGQSRLKIMMTKSWSPCLHGAKQQALGGRDTRVIVSKGCDRLSLHAWPAQGAADKLLAGPSLAAQEGVLAPDLAPRPSRLAHWPNLAWCLLPPQGSGERDHLQLPHLASWPRRWTAAP